MPIIQFIRAIGTWLHYWACWVAQSSSLPYHFKDLILNKCLIGFVNQSVGNENPNGKGIGYGQVRKKAEKGRIEKKASYPQHIIVRGNPRCACTFSLSVLSDSDCWMKNKKKKKKRSLPLSQISSFNASPHPGQHFNQVLFFLLRCVFSWKQCMHNISTPPYIKNAVTPYIKNAVTSQPFSKLNESIRTSTWDNSLFLLPYSLANFYTQFTYSRNPIVNNHILPLNGSQLAKMKKSIPGMSLP